MTTENSALPQPQLELPLPTPAESEAAAKAKEVESTANAAKLGIEYTDTFTLEDAAKSFNATRQAFTLPNGRVLGAEEQLFKPAPDWFKRHAGQFTLRRAGIFDRIKMQADRDALVGVTNTSATTDWLISATLTAKHLVTSAPEWFDLNKPGLDPDVLHMLHHWYREWDARFLD